MAGWRSSAGTSWTPSPRAGPVCWCSCRSWQCSTPRWLASGPASTPLSARRRGRTRRALARAGRRGRHRARPQCGGAGGSRVFGYSEASLHTKTFCFDRRTVYVGSLNLDPRSVDLNTELGLVVTSEQLAERIAAGFEGSTAPDRAWRLSLVPCGGGTRLVWHGDDAGRATELHCDPETFVVAALHDRPARLLADRGSALANERGARGTGPGVAARTFPWVTGRSSLGACPEYALGRIPRVAGCRIASPGTSEPCQRSGT